MDRQPARMELCRSQVGATRCQRDELEHRRQAHISGYSSELRFSHFMGVTDSDSPLQPRRLYRRLRSR
jgi:hypothetical protein